MGTLQADFDLVPVFTVEQAIARLKDGAIGAILCSIHFDEPRMFDLLREATQIAPGTPFVCCVMRVVLSNSDDVTYQTSRDNDNMNLRPAAAAQCGSE